MNKDALKELIGFYKCIFTLVSSVLLALMGYVGMNYKILCPDYHWIFSPSTYTQAQVAFLVAYLGCVIFAVLCAVLAVRIFRLISILAKE